MPWERVVAWLTEREPRFVGGPKTMLNRSPASPETKADKIVKVAIWKPLDIQIDRRALNLQFRAADDVDFALTNREAFMEW